MKPNHASASDENMLHSPAIDVSHFTKVYEGFEAVRDLSFTVQVGEVVGIVGANGAGKTSLLRTLTGILRPASGSLRICGYDIEREPVAAKRQFAYLSDTPQPYELLTVLEHLKFTSLAYGLKTDPSGYDAVLDELGLTEKKHALASTLSRGMKQKLALACAFVRNPRVIILDEPLTGLDPKAIRNVKESIRRRTASGTAFLLSSHLLELLEKLCDRVLILHQGRKVAFGLLDEIRTMVQIDSSAGLEDVFFAITENSPDRMKEAVL